MEKPESCALPGMFCEGSMSQRRGGPIQKADIHVDCVSPGHLRYKTAGREMRGLRPCGLGLEMTQFSPTLLRQTSSLTIFVYQTVRL